MKHLVVAAIVLLTAPCLSARCESSYLYRMDFVPHDDTVQAVLWLDRGIATRVDVADGQAVKLSDSRYKSFRIQKWK